MNRLLSYAAVLMLALTGCHQAASTSTADKKDTPPLPTTADPASTVPKPAVTFKPQTGQLVSSDEIPLLEQIDRENTKVLAAVMPGVVRISASRVVDPRSKLFSNNLALQFHFGPQTTRNFQQNDPSYGAGVVLSKDGYIVTNTHLIDEARDVEVQLHDKRSFPARLVASDAALDIAILKIEATDLFALPWANSDHVQVGEQVFAIGNPFNQEGSVSRGIVSATARTLPDSPGDEEFIQTDAAVNPGNSGGALINIHGELIGINTLIASTSGGNEGVGFAIPSNLVNHAVKGLLKGASEARGYLGVRFPETIDDGVRAMLHLGATKGALLAGVYPGTPADKAGLHTGDFITEMDGHKINGAVDLRLIVAQIPIGKEVAVKYIREGAPASTRLTIVQAPASLHPGDNPVDDSLSSAVPKAQAPDLESVLSGLQVDDLNDKSRREYAVDGLVDNGVIVESVQYSSPADLKGISRGDVIESVKVSQNPSHEVTSAKDFTDLVKNLKPDDSVVVLVHHGKASSFVYLAPQK